MLSGCRTQREERRTLWKEYGGRNGCYLEWSSVEISFVDQKLDTDEVDVVKLKIRLFGFRLIILRTYETIQNSVIKRTVIPYQFQISS